MANKYKVERKEKQYEWLVNTAKYYKGSFSTELIQDIIEIDNTFETIKIETDDHKTLEKTYIRFLYENGYELYNKRLYKNHDWSIDEIDMSIIKIL